MDQRNIALQSRKKFTYSLNWATKVISILTEISSLHATWEETWNAFEDAGKGDISYFRDLDSEALDNLRRDIILHSIEDHICEILKLKLSLKCMKDRVGEYQKDVRYFLALRKTR